MDGQGDLNINNRLAGLSHYYFGHVPVAGWGSAADFLARNLSCQKGAGCG